MKKSAFKKILKEQLLKELTRAESAKFGFDREYEPKTAQVQNLDHTDFQPDPDDKSPEAYTTATVVGRLERIQYMISPHAEYKPFVRILEKIIDSVEDEEDIVAYKLFKKIFSTDGNEKLKNMLAPYYMFVTDRMEEERKAINEACKKKV